MKFIKENNYIPIVQLSEKIGINVRNTEKNIDKLKKKGLLKRVGGAKGGHWVV